MRTLNSSEKDQLVNQLKLTLFYLGKAKRNSYEAEIEKLEQTYNDSLIQANEKSGYTTYDCKSLLNLARGYLETSSKWDQEFLNQMGKTEKLIKSFGTS